MKKLFPSVLALIFFIVINSIFIINEAEQAVVTQFGKPVGTPIVDAGLKFKIPFIQKVIRFEKRILEWDGAANEITTKDDKYIFIDTFARWKISDPLTFYKAAKNERNAQSRLDDVIDGIVRDEISNRNMEEIIRSTGRSMETYEDEWDMRYTISRNINCDDLGSNYIDVDGEWVASSNIKVLIGACADQGLETFYWDEDGDGFGSNQIGEYCLDNLPDGWVSNNEDVDDSIYCSSNSFDDCWVCDGENYLMDCNQVCSPGTPVGQMQQNQGLIYGAFLDDCDVCSGGSTQHVENSDQDCAGICFGEAFYDDCDVCSGGSTEHLENSDQDCAGVCFGDADYDSCGECNGQNQSCLDDIFGSGPSDLYAQINLDLEEIDLTWNYNDFNDEVIGYYIWEYNNESYNLVAQIETPEVNLYTISEVIAGTFCVSAFDEYQNESSRACADASELSNFNFILDDEYSYLVSFPYLSNEENENSLQMIFGEFSDNIIKIVGQGDASQYSNGSWVGSISELERKQGYWIVTNDNYDDPITLSVSGIPTDPNTIYTLMEGWNLISYVGPDSTTLADALPDHMQLPGQQLIGEAQATEYSQALGGWVGSLTHLYIGKGYWIKSETDFLEFAWNNTNSQQSNEDTTEKQTHKASPFNFKQSSLQSFYFIEEIDALTFDLDKEDVIVSYCNEMVVGSRYYGKGYPDIPAMGHDSDNTAEYCSDLDTPNFKIYDTETGRLIDLHGNNIPEWENLGIYRISLSEVSSEEIPSTTDIISLYPNPFNPSTNIDIYLEQHQEITISIYDINGKLIDTLADGYLNAGGHTFIWSPEDLSSGVYIISLRTNQEIITNKILYLK